MYFLRSGIPFVRFLIIFMIGLYVGISYPVKLPEVYGFGLFIIYVLLNYLKKVNPWLIFIKSFIGSCILFFMGILLVNARTEKNDPEHFIHSLDSIKVYQARVISMPEYTDKTVKIIVEMRCFGNQLAWKNTNGKVICYVQKGNEIRFQKGDLLFIKGTPSLPSSPANPEQFDYAEYLSRQNINAIHFIKKEFFIKVGYEEDFFLIKTADSFRSFCDEKIREGIKGENEYRMTSALLLGVRAGLDEKLYEAYSSTGTVHALAVSGLHVSLIYFIVVMVFGSFKKIKYGKFIFATLSILIFWFYALVTGFSPSVVRAVAMFSVFLIAGILRKNAGIYNTLAFSAFTILCFEPFWLLDIGFQFSFLAVVGIAYIYPIMFDWWVPENWLIGKLWAMVCVSLAAQIAVSPLSIYYFHSFPLLFLPFNMLIVPLSSLALYTGLGALMVYKIKFVSDLLFLVTEYVVRFMNYFVLLPEGSEFLKADFIYLDRFELILIYLFICLFFFALKNRNYKSFVYSFIFVFAFSFAMFYHKILKNSKDSFTQYKIKNRVVVSLIHDGHALILSDIEITQKDKIFRYNVYNHLASERINSISFDTFKNTKSLAVHQCSYGQLMIWSGKRILKMNEEIEKRLPKEFLSKIDHIIINHANP
jgi:competence protein ComEC